MLKAEMISTGRLRTASDGLMTVLVATLWPINEGKRPMGKVYIAINPAAKYCRDSGEGREAHHASWFIAKVFYFSSVNKNDG
jgi:hypothetical protein